LDFTVVLLVVLFGNCCLVNLYNEFITIAEVVLILMYWNAACAAFDLVGVVLMVL
jgi:hypothetical protein